MGDTARILADADYMRQALALACRAAEQGEVPIGAVVVAADGRVIGQGWNQREQLGDATAHAEMSAIRAACAAAGGWRLSGATLYVTLEPCPMCIGAAINARLSKVVFGAEDPRSGACGSLLNIPAVHPLNHRLVVEGGLLADECAACLRAFFARRRG